MRFKDMPGGEPPPESEANKVMHVALPIGQGKQPCGAVTGQLQWAL
jgi:hypothetical protein